MVPGQHPPADGSEPRGFDRVLLPILAVAAFLILKNLDSVYLWTDEAEAACLGKSILENGLPIAFDGKNYVTQWIVAKREDFNDDLVWVLSPWLQLYVCAASFALFGATTLAARLPFALVGLLNFWMVHRLGLRVTGDRRIARLASCLMLTCIPILLHSRQARYYPVAMLATMWALYAYVGALERRRGAGLQLVAAVTILFHANYGLCVPLLLALGLHAAVYAWRRARLATVVGSLLGIAATTLPWALYAEIHRTTSRLELEAYAWNLLNYLHSVNQFALPFVLLAAFAVLRPLGWRSPQLSLRNPGVTAVALACTVSVFFVATNVGYFTRYIINVYPLFVLLCAVLVVWLADGARERLGPRAGRAAWALVPVIMLTTVLSLAAGPLLVKLARAAPHRPWMDLASVKKPLFWYSTPRHEIWDFLGEITHDFDGPLEGIVEFLRRNATPDQTIYIDYGDLPVLFYTDLTVRGGLQGAPYDGTPEWIVHRQNRAGVPTNQLKLFVRDRGYVPITLPEFPDTRWENRPDPYSHFYRTATVSANPYPLKGDYPPVVIFKRPDVPVPDPGTARVGQWGL